MKKLYILPASLLQFSLLTHVQPSVGVMIDGMSNSNIISHLIYGHFSEHPGRCINDGF